MCTIQIRLHAVLGREEGVREKKFGTYGSECLKMKTNKLINLEEKKEIKPIVILE